MLAYSFSGVQYEPQYSEVDSRSDVDTSTMLGDMKLDIPVISANMADITGSKMAIEMAKNGGLGILHRFMGIEENIQILDECREIYNEEVETDSYSPDLSGYRIGVSIGIGQGGRDRFEALYAEGARTFCVDVAHGHHIHVKEILQWIRSTYTDKQSPVILIAGNVATPKGAFDVWSWGADIVKVGVGPGSCCKTRQNTGVGLPQLYVLEQIRTQHPHIPLIADGGIKETGDINKALKYADAVMLGSMLSGTTETPGHVYKDFDGKFYKVFGGSASGESKTKSGKGNSFVEGAVKTVPFRGHVKYILREIKDNLQSCCSYNGAMNIKELQKNGKLIPISDSGRTESKL